MRRREFIAGISVAVWPPVARAQQTGVPVVGFLGAVSASAYVRQAEAFQEGLKEAGLAVGQNVAIEYRWAENHNDRLPALAADLVHRQVAAIATTGSPATLAAKAATTIIPIIFQTGYDPVATGFVRSLSQPGSNLTGVTTLAVELDVKRLELLHETLPAATFISMLLNPTSSPNAETQLTNLRAAARILGLELHVLTASSESEFGEVFTRLKQLRAAGLAIGADALFNSRSEQLALLALRYGIPTIYQFREFVVAGGLMSYGGSLTDAHRLVGVYTGRILKGERPGDLPVQQSTKVELMINLETARALGLTLPLTLLARADEVIE
jgi:putative tryptophan/tyrosine transport system substrate-binding protein